MPFVPQLPVPTERLVLRALRVSDADDLVAYRSIPDVCRYVPFQPQTRAEILDRIAGMWAPQRLDEDGSAQTIGVEHDGRVIGDVVVFWHSREHRGGEIGYVIHPDAGGHGLATEAVTALVDLAFDPASWPDEPPLHRLVARVDARNDASARLLRRLGFRQEAHLRENEWFKGQWSDELDFALLATEWNTRPARP